MGYKIRKNWITSFNLIVTRPVVLLPFLIIAFLEGLAVELIYFSPRKPLANIFNPIIRKFFGEAFLHYPANLVILPQLFYFIQIAIYILIGVLLTGICVNIVKNVRMSLPSKRNVLIKNALKRYLSFIAFGALVVMLMFLLNKADVFIFTKALKLTAKHLPQVLLKTSPFILTFFVFLSNIILQTFLILVIPIIVFKKRMLFKALLESIILGFRNFLSLFMLIFLPFLIYLPITLLKSGAPKLMERTFPEINLYITVAGVILTAFIECFVIVCASQFLLDKEGPK